MDFKYPTTIELIHQSPPYLASNKNKTEIRNIDTIHTHTHTHTQTHAESPSNRTTTRCFALVRCSASPCTLRTTALRIATSTRNQRKTRKCKVIRRDTLHQDGRVDGRVGDVLVVANATQQHANKNKRIKRSKRARMKRVLACLSPIVSATPTLFNNAICGETMKCATNDRLCALSLYLLLRRHKSIQTDQTANRHSNRNGNRIERISSLLLFCYLIGSNGAQTLVLLAAAVASLPASKRVAKSCTSQPTTNKQTKENKKQQTQSQSKRPTTQHRERTNERTNLLSL
jgi:hypothetical protein